MFTDIIPHMIDGFSVAFTFQGLLMVTIGCVVGTIIGALPGLLFHQVCVDHRVRVDSDELGVCANEAAIENAARQVLEIITLHGLEVPDVDLGRLGDLAQTDPAEFALAFEFFTERGHGVLFSLRSRPTCGHA